MARSAPAGSFTGQLTTLAQKRVGRERLRIEQDTKELAELGIYVQWGDELHKAVALIVGPEGTPYERGFYFFDIKISDNYPLQPPMVDFKTGDGRVRFNPNLYVEGKVCLSILGTWSGPSWTTSCSLRTVLVSIQSLLNEHPIQNEPGHEKETGKNDRLYSEIIGYENIAVGVARMLRHTPEKFGVFRPTIRRIFLEQYDNYVKTLEGYKAKEGTSVKAPIWNFAVKYKPQELLKELAALREELHKEVDRQAPDASAVPAVLGVQNNPGTAATNETCEPAPPKRQRTQGPDQCATRLVAGSADQN